MKKILEKDKKKRINNYNKNKLFIKIISIKLIVEIFLY